MPDVGITISTGEVMGYAKNIRTINDQLYDGLIEMKKRMDELQNTWQSDAGEAIRQHFDALLPRFGNYKDIITAYADFLDKTAVQYETIEAALTGNANQFK